MVRANDFDLVDLGMKPTMMKPPGRLAQVIFAQRYNQTQVQKQPDDRAAQRGEQAKETPRRRPS